MPTSTKFYSLFASVFLLFAGYGLFLNSAGVELAEMGVGEITIGILNAAFFVGAASSAVAAHRIVSSVGHIRSFSVFGALFSISALGHIMLENLWVWGILRILLGFCYYSLLMIIESWFSEKTTVSTRGKVLANYNLVFYLSFTLGIALLSLKLSSSNIFILAAMFVVMSMLPVSLTRIKEPQLPPRDRISVPRVLMIAPLALVASFIGGLLVNGFYTMASVFLLNLKFSVQQISIYLMVAMVGGFVTQIPIASLSDRYGRRNAILVCSLLATISAALGIVAIFYSSDNLWLQYGVAFLLGASLFTLYALSIARANDVIPKEMSTVEVSRSLLFAYGTGALIAPPLLGVVMSQFVDFGFYSFYAICSLILVLYTLSQKSVPEEELSEYVVMPAATTAIATELDPRNNKKHAQPFDEDIIQQYQECLEQVEAEARAEAEAKAKAKVESETKEKKNLGQEQEKIEESVEGCISKESTGSDTNIQ
ncbi:MFS transporter [Pasteurellaceae bacterium HPA106]|nr:MFS transporter [Spirabiliibacterium pneumoniae]MBE2895372.1 MFS transporter [Spirabiliibacterium pneumoniae]